MPPGPDIVAAGGLPDRQRQSRDQEARQADDEEDDLPGSHRPDERQVDLVEVLQYGEHRRREHGGEPGADGGAGDENRDGRAPALRREEVGDHGHGGRAEGGLAGADADTAEEQRPERSREAAGRRREAPDGNAGGDDEAP